MFFFILFLSLFLAPEEEKNSGEENDQSAQEEKVPVCKRRGVPYISHFDIFNGYYVNKLKSF